MLRVIEDAKVVRQCQSRLLAQVEAATTEKKQHIIGFPGGSAEATVYYMGSLDFWMTLKPISNRYWNCGGLGYPFGSTAPAPHVEINPPLSGIDRRIAGAFLEDDDGVRYIAHNGKVGGGAKGVSKTAFLKHYPATSMVLSGDMEIPMYVVGRLDHPRLPQKLRDFTRISAEFRKAVKSGTAPGVVEPKAEGHSFSPEYEGTKTYSTAELVEAACTHGLVVKALRESLAGRGVEAFNTGALDLFVPAADGSMALLFEVKSHADTTNVYGALGQLMFHGGAGAAKRLTAVLPEDVDADKVRRLQQLGVGVVTFALDSEEGNVEFGGLDSVLALGGEE